MKGNFIKQCKGKTLDATKLNIIAEHHLAMIKYDGFYVQIHKNKNVIKFYSSSGKEFYLDDVANDLQCIKDDFVIEAEYIHTSEGKLGDRIYAAKLNSYIADFKNNRKSIISEDIKFVVFDLVVLNGKSSYFEERIKHIDLFKSSKYFIPVQIMQLYEESSIHSLFNDISLMGYEGIIIKHKKQVYIEGKRTKFTLKYKKQNTCYKKCVDIIPGKGKYENKIGSLVVQHENTLVSVGSGLTDYLRFKDKNYFIGKFIYIKYEQMTSNSLIQPIFISVKDD